MSRNKTYGPTRLQKEEKKKIYSKLVTLIQENGTLND